MEETYHLVVCGILIQIVQVCNKLNDRKLEIKNF